MTSNSHANTDRRRVKSVTPIFKIPSIDLKLCCVFRPRCLCFPLNSAVCWPLLCSWGRKSYDSKCKSHANTDGRRLKSVNAPLSGTGPQSGRTWFELRYAMSPGAGARCGLSFDTLPRSRTIWVICRSPPSGAGPNQGGYGLSFQTPSHREPGPDVA